MDYHKIPPGSKNVTLYVQLLNVAAAATGLTITNLDITFVRQLAAAVKADATALGSATAAHADNKMFEVDGTNAKGLYRLDLPDTVCAIGVDSAEVVIGGTGAFDDKHVHLDLKAEEVDLNGNNCVRDDFEYDALTAKRLINYNVYIYDGPTNAAAHTIGDGAGQTGFRYGFRSTITHTSVNLTSEKLIRDDTIDKPA